MQKKEQWGQEGPSDGQERRSQEMRGIGVQGPNPGINLRPQVGGEAQEGIAALAVAEGNERQKEIPTNELLAARPGAER